jgi:integrase
LSSHHKLPRDPLASVKKPNPKADRRRERRMLLPEEWRRLEAATESGPERHGMTGRERLMLYETAIQSGLRSNELRSLMRGRLYLDSDPPYITCKAGSTKNRKDARQYIQTELSASLKAHIATKAPKAPVFNLPHESNLARMLRNDLAEARKQWIGEAKDDPQEYAQRQQGDFLADRNHDGEVFDFHSLRHTCGAWLAMIGAHPKVIQTVMRHGSITLTMDSYGHLCPGQEAAAISQMRQLLVDPPEALRATGTDNATVDAQKPAQRQAQRTGRETRRSAAKGCDQQSKADSQRKTAKPLRVADLGDAVRKHSPKGWRCRRREELISGAKR